MLCLACFSFLFLSPVFSGQEGLMQDLGDANKSAEFPIGGPLLF